MGSSEALFKTKETFDKPYEKWTNKELQDLLRTRELQTSGKKDILVDRLRKSESGDKLKKTNVRTPKQVSSRPTTSLASGATYLTVIPPRSFNSYRQQVDLEKSFHPL